MLFISRKTIPFLFFSVIMIVFLSGSVYFAPPVANDDTYTMRPNTTLSVDAESGLLANDSDPDGDPMRVVSTSSAENGTLSVFTDGSFTYTPNEDFTGVEQITYTNSDGVEETTATLTIEVVNKPPVANDDTYTMRPNTTLSVDAESGLLANDTDPDGDPMRVVATSSAENGTLSVFTDGSFTYTPNEDFTGVEQISYTNSDGLEETTATLTIEVVNEPPVATDDTYTMRPNTTLSVDAESGLLANDSDPDGDPTGCTSRPYPGYIIGDAQNGTLEREYTGWITYTPEEDLSVGVEQE